MASIKLPRFTNHLTSVKKSAIIVLSLFLLLILVFIHLTSGSASANIRLLIDGHEISSEVAPKMINERIIVPLRPIAEALDLRVNWEEATQTVTASNQDTEIKLVINGTAFKNGIPIILDVPALLIDGHTMVPARFVSEAFLATVSWDQATRTVYIATINNYEHELPIVGSYENLKNLLAQSADASYRYRSSQKSIAAIDDAAVSNSAITGSSAPSYADNAKQDNQYSKTNTQVEGVDEADLVKTDGQYLYQANQNRIVVMRAYPPEDMQITQIIEYKNNFYPQELYLDDQHLVVVGSSVTLPPVYTQDSAKKMPELYPSLSAPTSSQSDHL